ncbi:MAG: shikimate dehydrogenase [Thermaerobacter sp.]|nr:shikimate dehydrogenase [Thermaerobacter sp.]
MVEHPRPALYGVLGHPVVASRSPDIHRAAYQAMGWTHCHYVPVDTMPHRLTEVIAAFTALGGRGLNITIPLKAAVLGLPFMHSRDPWVLRAGVANTLARRPDGSWEAFNTDGPALYGALAHRAVEPRRVLVLGGGGAARASVLAVQATAETVVVATRTPVAWVGALDVPACRRVAWADALRWVPEADVIINATPLGQEGRASWDPVPRFQPGQCVVDWVYGDAPTRLVQQAQADGAAIIDGRELLVRQAAGAWARWFGDGAPVSAMAGAVGLAGTGWSS